MLNNMFNLFDPYSFNMPLNYYMMMLIMIFIYKMNYWINNYNHMNFIKNMFNNEIFFNNNIMNKTMMNMFITLIMFMFMINLNNLIPNLFYISSNMMFSLNLSFFFINNFLFLI